MSLEADFQIPPASNSKEFPWPIGRYICRLDVLAKEKPTQFTKEDDPPRIRFEMTVVGVIDSDDRRKARDLMRAGEKMLAWTPLNMGPRAWFRLWAEALLGRELAEKEQIQINDLVQRQVKVDVSAYKVRNGPRAGQTAVGVQSMAKYVMDEDDDLPPPPEPSRPMRTTAAVASEDDSWMDDPRPVSASPQADPAVR